MDESVFSVKSGIHPVVASTQLTTFVSNDCHMQPHQLWVVTGPNMGGEYHCISMHVSPSKI